MQHEMLIKNTLDRLGCSADIFCVLAGISQSRLSRALRGIQPLTGPECQALSKIAEDLSALADGAMPFTLSFRNLEAVRTLLEHRRNGIRWVATVILEPKKEQDQQQQ
jgi:transcriptional regulator with XRE-family HTH domain